MGARDWGLGKQRLGPTAYCPSPAPIGCPYSYSLASQSSPPATAGCAKNPTLDYSTFHQVYPAVSAILSIDKCSNAAMLATLVALKSPRVVRVLFGS